MERLFEMVSRFERGYPDIEIPAEIDAAIRRDDPKPFYFTLPVMKVGATSRNKRLYPREVVEDMRQQIKEKKPVGDAGHLRDEDRPYTWQPSPVRWLNAEIDDNGLLWARGYALPEFPKMLGHLRTAINANALQGTSIYGSGTGEMMDNGVVHITKVNLESIDLAHPDRIGVPDAATVPMVTQETILNSDAPYFVQETVTDDAPQDDTETLPDEIEINETEGDMPDEPQVLSELRETNDRLTRRVRELEALEEMNRVLERDLNEVREQLAIGETADPIREIHRLQTQIADKDARLTSLTSVAVAEAVNSRVEFEGARAFVREQLDLHLRAERLDLPTSDQINRVLEAVLARDSVAAHITAEAQKALGPNISQSGRKPAGASTTNETTSLDAWSPVLGKGGN